MQCTSSQDLSSSWFAIAPFLYFVELCSFAISKVTAQGDLDLPSPHLPYALRAFVCRGGDLKSLIFQVFQTSFYMLAQPAKSSFERFKCSFQLAYFHYTEKENMVFNLWCLARHRSKQVPAEPRNRKENQTPACSTLTQSAIRMLETFNKLYFKIRCVTH